MVHTVGVVSCGIAELGLAQRARDAGHEVITGSATDLDPKALSECGLVIVGPCESASACAECLHRIEPHLSLGAILASGATVRSVDGLAATLQRPEQFLAFEQGASPRGEPAVRLRMTVDTAPGVAQALRRFFEALGETVVDAPTPKGPASALFGRRPSRIFGPPSVRAASTTHAE